MDEITQTDIVTWDLGQLWNYIQSIKDEMDIDEEFKQIKHGIKLIVPIQYLIEERCVDLRPQYRKVFIQGYGKCDIQDYWDDIDMREGLMRSIIMAYHEKEEIHEGRTTE